MTLARMTFPPSPAPDMAITHHPSEPTLAAFAAGSLSAARSLVVGTHLSLCPRCRQRVAAFGALGGALLDGVEPAATPAGALERILARLGETEAPVSAAAPPASARPDAPEDHLLPGVDLGPWRWIGRGVQWRTVKDAGAQADGGRIFMLRAAGGTKLPSHSHAGTEWTCVLSGAFIHGEGRFGPGDFDEADADVDHHPTVEAGADCVCLVALTGHIAFHGWLGRMLQPFVRI